MIHDHLIVGFCGAAGSGKTTLAKAVRDRLKLRSRQNVSLMKFAQPIREMLRVVGVEKGDVDGENAHPLFRGAAQHIGQWFRDQDADFWVNVTRHAIEGQSVPSIVLIDDVRYENEAAMCDLVVKVRTNRPSTLNESESRHASETGWAKLPSDLTLYMDNKYDVLFCVGATIGCVLDKPQLSQEAA